MQLNPAAMQQKATTQVEVDAGEQQEEEAQQRQTYPCTHYYNNILAAFERELNKWMQHEFNHCRLLFEEQQQEAYQCALTFLPALH
jgi:hypothetical protein